VVITQDDMFPAASGDRPQDRRLRSGRKRSPPLTAELAATIKTLARDTDLVQHQIPQSSISIRAVCARFYPESASRKSRPVAKSEALAREHRGAFSGLGHKVNGTRNSFAYFCTPAAEAARPCLLKQKPPGVPARRRSVAGVQAHGAASAASIPNGAHHTICAKSYAKGAKGLSDNRRIRSG